LLIIVGRYFRPEPKVTPKGFSVKAILNLFNHATAWFALRMEAASFCERASERYSGHPDGVIEHQDELPASTPERPKPW